MKVSPIKRKYFLLTVFAVFLSVTFVACTPDVSVLPMSVSLNVSSLLLAPGESRKLTVEVIPDESTIKSLTWTSSNPEVATVADGVVTAIAEGKSVITVTTNSGKKTTTCILTVAYLVSSVTLDKYFASLAIGKSLKLTANVMPQDAPDKSIRWESSNPEIAEVTDDGFITAKVSGTATITAITEVGHRRASCTVRVLENYITMTLQASGSLKFSMVGSGLVNIDWGDGSPFDTRQLFAYDSQFQHDFYGTPPHTVTIDGNVTILDCGNNQLTNLDVSNCITLTNLNCSQNQLVSLDVSKNTDLISLNCWNNQITELKLSGNTALTNLECNNNRLTDLDVSNCVALTNLICTNNRLISLEVKMIAVLNYLDCSHNQLMDLNVSNNTNLSRLDCSSNLLASLDMSNNILLANLQCKNNQLSAEALNDLFETLHENTIAGGKILSILGNPGTLVSNQSVLHVKGWQISEGSIITMTLQPVGEMSVNVTLHGSGTVDIDWGDGSTMEKFYIQQNRNYNHNYTTTLACTIMIYGNSITMLECTNNQITSLDVSNNTALTSLYCSSNRLTSLDLSNNTVLTRLICSYNKLTVLDMSKNIALVYLDSANNQLSADAINALFRTLPSYAAVLPFPGLIRITGNPGTNACDRNIAWSKGWQVEVSN